jgi:hypothetical protein
LSSRFFLKRSKADISQKRGISPTIVTLEITPAAEEPEPEVPANLRKALAAAAPKARVVVGHHSHRASRLDPLDHLRQASRDARAPDQKCLLKASGREATRLLLRPVRVLQQRLERS